MKPTSPNDLPQWERCNDLANSLIINSIMGEIRSSILNADQKSYCCSSPSHNQPKKPMSMVQPK
jgi:hypothetical protein